ncbi:MAG: endonuclease III [Gemmatimonadota bacterium]|jgi:endonuclease III
MAKNGAGQAWDRIPEIRDALAAGGPVEPKRRRDPLDELVLTILSQNTTDVNCLRGWEGLRARFPDWESLLAAPERELEEAIRPAGLAAQKSRSIRAALVRLGGERGSPGLDHLDGMEDEEALDYLAGFHGVGVKTAACVLCFALGRDVMPVDTHVHRVARRLGLVPGTATAARTHAVLNAVVPPELRHDLHLLFVRHGRETCRARSPRCDACALRGTCPRAGVAGGT